MKTATLILISWLVTTLLSQAQEPHFQWANCIGGISGDHTDAITVDDTGNVYTTGIFCGTVDFDPNAGILNLISVGGCDIFISKTDPSGNLLWAKNFGGDQESVYSIFVDTSGNVYTTGTFVLTADFDPGHGISKLTARGYNDMFILKLDKNGNFIWVKQIGGANASESGNGIVVDKLGNVYTTGSFQDSVDFDPSDKSFILKSYGMNEDLFISKLDSNGNFIWAKQIGGLSSDHGSAIALDASANIYLTGAFGGEVDFDPNDNKIILTSVNYSDIFISKFNTDGNLIWAKQFSEDVGPNWNNTSYALTVDLQENVYTVGTFASADFDPGKEIYKLEYTPKEGDTFISKLDSSGNFVWAVQLGGKSANHGYSISVDALFNVYTSGIFNGTSDFDPGDDVYNLASNNSGSYGDVFVSKINIDGEFVWATNFGKARLLELLRYQIDN